MASTESLDSQYLASSFDNLARSRSTNSRIVRTYKQATQLYLTKRFKDALDTLEPIISPHQTTTSNTRLGPAPVAQTSKTTRTKVWVFYLSLLSAITELGPEEGKLTFGSTAWRHIAAKAREGTVWEEIVSRGYAGVEAEVDADVVVNLATLLLGHMQDQKLNQQRLESYLSTSDTAGAEGGRHVAFAQQDGTSTPGSIATSSPKALAARLKILELYTLHVLPTNGEWTYAKEFVEMNDVLDEERREAFLQALQNLKEEKDASAQRERELEAQRQREMDEQRQAREEQEEARRVEEGRREAGRRAAEEEQRRATTSGSASGTKAANAASKPTTNSHSKPPQQGSRHPKPQRKPPPAAPPTLYHRASSILINLQQMVLHASRSMTNNSLALMRFAMFLLAFLLIIARRDLRMKIKRTLSEGLGKVKQTVGMGVRVSYI